MRSVFLLLLCAVAYSEDGVAIYHNASIYTVDAKEPRVQAIAVKGDRIAGVGEVFQLQRLFKDAKLVDLKGACVVPGFHDAHGHLSGLGNLKRQLDLRSAKSYAEVVQRVKAKAATVPAGTWILGGRWDQSLWGQKELPDNGKLSEATPEHPVLLSRVDGHAALANRLALELSNVDRNTKNPAGGEVLKRKDGEPTGMLIDRAMGLVRASVPEGGGLSTGALWEIAQKACFSAGLTCVHDAGVPRGALADLRARYERGALKLRVYAMLSYSRDLGDYLANTKPTGDPRFSVRAVKLYIDGAMGSRGAWLLEPYADRAGHIGLNTMPPAIIERLSKVAVANGWQINTHAIGDRANRAVLDAYEAAFKEHPGKDHRFRIEHAQCLHLDDIPRFAQLGVIASMQPTHATTDMRWAEDRLGPERIKGCYAWRRLLESNARLAFGSDFPVESENPFFGFYAAITRQDHDGKPEGGWLPDQKMTRAEALRLFTLDAAYAAFLENDLGSLKVGKLADFIAIDCDIMRVPARDIVKARVLRTVIAGETVYQAD